ncbi:Potassium voltage-gated channel sub H member 7 [Chytriomyces hyalinus]|nr:Potassium voltage-gated channel sub H member 7 [Chytriomyces hyalinus]
MNNEELYQFASDFRRLRADLIDRSNQILSMVEMALKRSTTAPTSPSEHLSYLDFGIRITEGDYVQHTESSQQLPQISLFSGLDKRPMARSLGASQAASLNEAGLPMLRSKSKKLLEPLKRSLTASQKLLVRHPPAPSQGEHADSARRTSASREPKRNSLKKTESADAAFLPPPLPYQSLIANDQPKNPALSAFAALKSQLSFVTEGNSPTSSSLFAESLIGASSSDGQPVSKLRTEIRAGQESESVEALIDQPHSPKQDTRFLLCNTVAIAFNDYAVPRFLNSNSSSLDGNTSQDSLPVLSLLTSPPASEFLRKSSFCRSISLNDSPGVICPPHASPHQKRGSYVTHKQDTQFSLVTQDHQSRRQSAKVETPKIQPPTLLEYLFLFPAYDNKGRRLTMESLAAYGKIDAVFRVNGIHPRSLFSNVWDLAMGVVMAALLFLIPFAAAYNPSYNLFDISSIFLCDSLVAVMTPQLVRSDISFFDLSEYEKVRPTLPVWMSYWMKRDPRQIPFPIFFPSQIHGEFLAFVYLIRCVKLYRNFFQCPFVTRSNAHLDEVAGISISRTLPLTGGILWFIHCNACTIYMMGSLTGFVGWSSMWPLVGSASLFETYVWTYYKAVGNMFPTSFNPWSPAEQIASFVYIIFAAIVYAVFLGAISSAVMAMNPSGRLFEQKVGELRDYIRSRDLSKETEERLLTYYETRYRGKFFEENAILSTLNDALKAEILLQNTRRLIENVPFLKRAAGDGRDELFMGRIAAALRSINFIPGDFVTKQGDSGSDMYFILNGKAEVYVNERHAVTLGAGAYFGEVGLIMKTLRTATVQAVLPSLIYRLTYLDFHKILDDFTDMRIRINMLAEEREKIIKLEEMSR